MRNGGWQRANRHACTILGGANKSRISAQSISTVAVKGQCSRYNVVA